ncbi:unnamed protein product, partial [Brachionus calyciflorus]
MDYNNKYKPSHSDRGQRGGGGRRRRRNDEPRRPVTTPQKFQTYNDPPKSTPASAARQVRPVGLRP